MAGPVEVEGTQLATGQRVVVGLESANMDEVHLCLGAELSRIEISTVLGALLDRLPGLRLAPGAVWRDVASPMFCGPQRVDVVW